MREQGRPRAYVVAIWTITAVVLALCVVAGNALLTGAGPYTTR